MIVAPEIIREVLNSEDIEGLLKVGAPADEYESEAQMIATAIKQTSESEVTEEQLSRIVRRVWAEMFGPFSEGEIEKRSAAFRQVARKIAQRRQAQR
jgi:hypothetical protein